MGISTKVRLSKRVVEGVRLTASNTNKGKRTIRVKQFVGEEKSKDSSNGIQKTINVSQSLPSSLP